MEGLTDARILNRAFMDHGRSEIIAYSIDAIDFTDVPNVLHSNREKCLMIARMLADQCSDAAAGKALCIIDADFDHYDRVDRSADPFLALTDFADLILYFAKPSALSYFGSHVFGEDGRVTEVLNQVQAACMTLFAARHGLREIAPQVCFVDDPAKACVIEGTTISIDIDRLVAQLLNPPGSMQYANTLKNYIEQFSFRRDLSHRCQMHGHDFIAVWRFALAKFGRGRFSNAVPTTTVEAIVYGAQPAVDFGSTTLLRTIFQKLCELSKP